MLSLQRCLSSGLHYMRTQHGPEVAEVRPVLLHVVRLRPYFGDDAGAMFLWKITKTYEHNFQFKCVDAVLCIQRTEIRHRKNGKERLSLPEGGSERVQLLSCRCWTLPARPSLLWCERPLQRAEEGSESLSPRKSNKSQSHDRRQGKNELKFYLDRQEVNFKHVLCLFITFLTSSSSSSK